MASNRTIRHGARANPQPRQMVTKAREDRQKGVQSVETAARILGILGDTSGPMTLTEVAKAADMSPSHTHSYLVSLVRAGLANKQVVTGRYELGPRTVQLGLRALGQTDANRVATEAMDKLCEVTDVTRLLAVWGERGPTLIRWDRSPTRPLMLNVNVGSTLPLLTTAIGNLFLAYMPSKATAQYLERELEMMAEQDTVPPFKTQMEVDALIARVRAGGLGRVQGVLFPSQIAVAAPIFDHQNQIVAALSMMSMGHEPAFAEGAATLQYLRAVTAEASEKLGYAAGPTITAAAE
jgi:DNA-binding IclR family transcriptional regulator